LPPTVSGAPPPAPNGAPPRRLTTPKVPVQAVPPPSQPPAPPITSAAPISSASRSALGARVVAGCRLIRPLVDGRVGSVHAGLRSGSTDEVSVRLLESPRGFDGAALERVRQETSRLAGLGHPNLVAVSEVVAGEGGSLHFIGERLSGTDLGTIIAEERRLEGGRALEIAIQVSRAVGAAHAAGVMHHHLEPERVLVAPGTGPDRIKVLDFGLAARAGAPLDVASALYRAPEQLTSATADARADVYATAALLYEMVTGAPPHAGSTDPIARKLAEPAQSPRMFRPEIPAELEALIMSSLDRDPAARPGSMAAFEEVLTSVARSRDGGPQTEESHAAAPPSPDRRRARREAAFRVIGELLTVPEKQPEADLLPPLIADLEATPPLDDPEARPTPLQAPSRELIAATESEPLPRDSRPIPASPNSAPTPAFGGAMLERYGDPGTGRTRGVVVALAVIAVAVTAAVLMMR
jgi:serine/threonine protein kinase